MRQRVNELQGRAVNNGALVALRPDTGEILAMVGSYDFYDVGIDGQVNVALAERQPGIGVQAVYLCYGLCLREVDARLVDP